MANLSPIPAVFIAQSQEEYGASTLASFLADLHSATQTGNHKNSWGLTIYRTVFTPESDEDFPLAVKRIDGYLRFSVGTMMRPMPTRPPPSIDLQAGEELLARLHHTVIEDRALDGASMETVERAFHDWVEENGDLGSDNPRYRFALVLDQEAVDETLRLPDPLAKRNGIDCHRSSCKGLTRWYLDDRMSCQWFWAAPSAMARVMIFSLGDGDDGPLAAQIEPISSEPLVFETVTSLNRWNRNCNKLTGYRER